MRDNCFRDDGSPRAITGARFTVLGPGRIRWELLADVDVLNHSEVISPGELSGVFEITQTLLQDAAHAEETAEQRDHIPAVDQQADRVSSGLDPED